jgi:hypothetical protein
MPTQGNSRKAQTRVERRRLKPPRQKRCNTYHDVRFSSNPNSKVQQRLDGSLLDKLWARTAVKRRT